MISRFIIPVIIFSLILTAPVYSVSIDFEEIATFSVPGLGEIEKIYFGDVDFDGHPEVLAADGDSVILYSSARDSVLLRYSISATGNPIEENFYGILLADINRDYLLDVAIGVMGNIYEWPVHFRIFFQSGTSSLGSLDSTTVEYQTATSWFLISPGVGLFKAIDFDGDGYGEFIFSCDSATGRFDYIEAEALIGKTCIFHTFPDSIIYQGGVFYTNGELMPAPHDDVAILHRYTQSYSHVMGSGQYYDNSSVSFEVISDFGEFVTDSESSDAVPGDIPRKSTYYSNWSVSTINCMGDLDVNHSGNEALIYEGATSCAGEDLEWNCNSEYRLKLCSVQNPDSFTEIRELPLINGAYSHIYLPDHPGYYCSFVADTFVQFNGTDGSEFQSTTYVPAGNKIWDYPYDDGYPYLITLNSNTVSIYKLAVITDADRGEDQPLPAHFTLGQPYPNPFNATQTIPVTTIPGGRLTVDIYNLLGQKIECIYSGIPYTRQLDISWKADHIASGIYFIKAVSGDKTDIRKSILLK